jgi:formate hydrogenlyase transcriptional activator
VPLAELALLGPLAKSLEAHDLVSFATRVLAAFAHATPTAWVEVAVRADSSGMLSAAIASPSGECVVASPRPTTEALLSSLRAPVLLALPPQADLVGFAEIARARSAGASLLLFVPAYRRAECIGQVVAAIRDARFSLSAELLESIAEVASAGLANVALIKRLAQLSRRAHRENRHLREDLQNASPSLRLTGSAPVFRQAIAAAEAVAPYTTPVLLRGESGTGKELMAMHVHERSPRARRPFLRLNCGAIPDGLVEGELFGHERGAFTGAFRRHEGVFERAHGGTVLLDEIAELPLASQVKLLRVLQSGEYQRIGGKDSLRADVRIIAATHRELEEMVAAGTFRTDLFFRLNVFPIVLPPLRERTQDLPLLASTLLRRLADRLGRPNPPPLDRQALARLEAYAWPGNVRELENVLERALILSPGPTLIIPDLPSASSARKTGAPASLATATRRHIEATLRECGGKVYGREGAAARLGVPPTTLQSKMLRLGIASRGGQR